MRSRLLILIVGLALAAAAPALAGGSEIGTSGVFSIGPGHSFVAWVPGAARRSCVPQTGSACRCRRRTCPRATR